jgi:hypothetical protein
MATTTTPRPTAVWRPLIGNRARGAAATTGVVVETGRRSSPQLTQNVRSRSLGVAQLGQAISFGPSAGAAGVTGAVGVTVVAAFGSMVVDAVAGMGAAGVRLAGRSVLVAGGGVGAAGDASVGAASGGGASDVGPGAASGDAAVAWSSGDASGWVAQPR